MITCCALPGSQGPVTWRMRSVKEQQAALGIRVHHNPRKRLIMVLTIFKFGRNTCGVLTFARLPPSFVVLSYSKIALFPSGIIRIDAFLSDS